MQKWEYAVQDIAVEEEGAFVPHPLNVLGDNRWELVAAIPEGSRYRRFLKRPVHPRQDPEVERLIAGSTI